MADTPNPGAQQVVQSQQAPGQPTTVVEGQQAPTQADPKDLSSQFAHLAKKAKAFREEQRKFQAERDAFNAERETWKSQNLTKYQGFEERVTKDPLGILEERGISRDQLASLLLNSENPEVSNLVFQLQQENKQLRQRFEQVDKRFEENERAAYEGAVQQIKDDATALVGSNAEQFELVQMAGEDGIEAIAELCKITWEKDKKLLSVEEAAQKVEQELFERSLKLASAKKVMAKFSQAQQPSEPQQTEQVPLKTQPQKTLNSQAAQRTLAPTQDRIRRAKLRAAGIDPDTGQKFGA